MHEGIAADGAAGSNELSDIMRSADRYTDRNVMVVNFSQEEILLPRTTVLGVAEDFSWRCCRY
jgi:hypothetical protein